jgi:hypothetical protein
MLNGNRSSNLRTNVQIHGFWPAKHADEVLETPQDLVNVLAENIPKAANYFFSYLLLQALSVSAGSLAQVVQLVIWFILRPIVDNTARQKFNRQLKLPSVQWGKYCSYQGGCVASSFISSPVVSWSIPKL